MGGGVAEREGLGSIYCNLAPTIIPKSTKRCPTTRTGLVAQASQAAEKLTPSSFRGAFFAEESLFYWS